MPEDRRAAYRAYDRVRRHELEIVTRLLEEILPEMPKPRGWSHQPHIGRPGPHRRGRPERFPWEPMAKALGLMHAMGWDYRQAEGNLWVASDIRRQIGLEEAPSRMTLWRAERRFSEEWLRELNEKVLAAFKKKSVPLAEEFERLRRTRRGSGSTRGGSGGRSASGGVSRSDSSASSMSSASAEARDGD
jgi:hypothetical protein